MFNRYQTSGDNRRKIVISAGLLVLLLILGIAGFRLFSGKDNGPDGPNNPVAGITYDQNVEEGGWSALSEEEIAAALKRHQTTKYMERGPQDIPPKSGYPGGFFAFRKKEVNRT